MRSRLTLARLLVAAAVLGSAAPAVTPAATAAYGDATISTEKVVVPMVFPVVGAVSYVDTYLACRSGCARQHMGQDLMGPKMRPLVATFNGVVHSIKREATVGDGNYVTLKGDNGWSANYIHVNNDSPGTDDGRGTARHAFAPGLHEGKRVFAGELIGWLGDSGNAEGTGAHLHFELRKGDPWSGVVYNAFHSLNAAGRLAAPRVSGPHADGQLVRSCSTCPVYEIRGGQKHYLRREVANEIGFLGSRVVTVSAGEVNYYPKGTDVELPAGRVYRGPDERLWLSTNHTRILLPDAAYLTTLGVSLTRVRPMTAAGLGTLRVAPAGTLLPAGIVYDGALLRPANGREYWLVSEGTRKLVPDFETMRSWGIKVEDRILVPVEVLENVEAPLPPLGTPLLLKDGEVVRDLAGRSYLISGGTKRPFGSADVYRIYGYNPVYRWTPPGAVLSRVPLGPALP